MGLYNKKEIGRYGENLVEDYLVKKGFKILFRNLRINHLEVDIVFRDENKDEIVFGEIKTRTSDTLDGVEQALKKYQIQKIKRAIMLYSQNNNIDLEKIRFDFIAVLINKENKKAKFTHFIDILE